MNILLIAALIPPLILMVMIYRMDKIEQEPVGLIVKLLIFGAIMCIPAAILEIIGTAIIGGIFGSEPTGLMRYLFCFIDAFLIVAVSEEFVKRFVLKRFTWNNPEFNYHFDGVVYAVAASLGFAALENVMYVCADQVSLSEGLSLAVSRGLMSIPGHCIFGIFMGIYYGQAKHAQLNHDPQKCKTMMKNSLLVPVLLHGFYDFCLFTGNEFFLTVFFVFLAVLYIRAFRTIRAYARADSPLDDSSSNDFNDQNFM